MKSNKYLDKVVGSLVRSTKIDYEKETIDCDFLFDSSPLSYLSLYSPHTYSFIDTLLLFCHPIPSPFEIYCKNTFGLTEDEIEYVWEEYKEIIEEKIDR